MPRTPQGSESDVCIHALPRCRWTQANAIGGDFRGIGIPSGYLTMENGPFVDGLPIKDADFPTAMSNNQMVYGKYIGNLEIEQDWTS